MKSPMQNINVAFKEKYISPPEPKFSFVSFLDDYGNSFGDYEENSILYYENDKDNSFNYRYHVKNNYHEFKNVTNKRGIQPGCKRFWTRFRYAKNVYILDKFFDEDNFFRLLYEITQNENSNGYIIPTVKIISEKLECLRRWSTKFPIVFARQDHIGDLTFFHDRFVWMDGEIWHFGAAAGGMHAGYQAVSGGWEDKGGCFEKLCESFFC